jgi:hypothetical protein
MTTTQAKASTTAAAAAEVVATVEDFRHFHGMCCRPSTAKRCIEAFTGVILFMPHTYHYYVEGKQQDDGNNNSTATTSNQKKEKREAASSSSSSAVPDLSSQDYGWILNLWLYYALVVFSLTGLWTVLGKTKFLIGRQEQDLGTTTNKKTTKRTPLKLPLTSEATINDLVMYPCVMDYIQQQHPDSTEFYLARHFEYDFVGLLQVMMIHISDNQGKLHLVEIFKIQVPLLAKAAAVVKSLLQSSRKSNKRD